MWFIIYFIILKYFYIIGEKYSLFIHFSVFSIQERKMDPRIFDYLMLVLFAGAMIAIAIVTRNRSKSVNDFLLAGKKGLNGWMKHHNLY